MQDLLDAVEWFFTSSWQFFTDCRIPVLDISFASLLIGLVLIDVFFVVLGMIVGVSFPTVPRIPSPKADVSSVTFPHPVHANYIGAGHTTTYRLPNGREHDER